jgi:hypothetical protein
VTGTKEELVVPVRRSPRSITREPMSLVARHQWMVPQDTYEIPLTDARPEVPNVTRDPSRCSCRHSSVEAHTAECEGE